jgi:hypothetical protein
MVPWKVAWAGDSTYKTHHKSKEEQEDKLFALQYDMAVDARYGSILTVNLIKKLGELAFLARIFI